MPASSEYAELELRIQNLQPELELRIQNLHPELELRIGNLKPELEIRMQIQTLHPAYQTNLRWLVCLLGDNPPPTLVMGQARWFYSSTLILRTIITFTLIKVFQCS